MDAGEKKFAVEIATPEMGTDGNKESKKKTKWIGLAESTSQIAATLNWSARAMESEVELLLFQVDMTTRGERQKKLIIAKIEIAELQLENLLNKSQALHRQVLTRILAFQGHTVTRRTFT